MSAIAIRYGTLHTNAGDPEKNGTLLVQGDRVTAIGPEVAIPEGARIVDAACVTPGLINCHAHLEMSGEANTTKIGRAHV